MLVVSRSFASTLTSTVVAVLAICIWKSWRTDTATPMFRAVTVFVWKPGNDALTL
ncbi:hypothetical protein D3C83_248990 [compost metagenome]